MTEFLRARVLLALFFSILAASGLAACQSGPATPEAGILWVDPGQELGVISPYVLGANHGPWSDFNPKAFEKAIELGPAFLRWPGGNWGDENNITHLQIDNYIAQAQKIGAEPSISVRVPNSSPEKAAEIVRYTNIDKGYAVKYWNLGNEPSLYSKFGEEWTPEYYAKTWREFALAMEAVDPSILFYGPDIHQFVGNAEGSPMEGSAREYLIEFLKVNGDMVDVVTVHRYPFPSCRTCPPPTWEELRSNAEEWSSTFPNLRRIIKETTGKELPVGMMEYNSNYTNAAGGDTTPDSFYNALWVADIYGRMVKERPEMLGYWLLKNNDAGHGMITSFNVRPSYYVFSLWSRFGNHLLAANSDTQYVSVYAAKTEAGAVTVMLLNLNGQDVVKPLKLVEGDALKLAEAYRFDASHNAEAVELPVFKNGGEVTLPAESVTLLVFQP